MKNILIKISNLLKQNLFFKNSIGYSTIVFFLLSSGIVLTINTTFRKDFNGMDIVYKNSYTLPWFLGFILLFFGIYFLVLLCLNIYRELHKDLKNKRLAKNSIPIILIKDFLIATICLIAITKTITICLKFLGYILNN